MVKYTVAASVALLQLAMFAHTSVALPIEQYSEGLESREISNSNVPQLAERDDVELEERHHPALLAAGGLAAAGTSAYLIWKAYQAFQAKKAAAGTNQPPTGQPQDNSPTNPGDQTGGPIPGVARRDLPELDDRDWQDIMRRYFDVLDERDGLSHAQADAFSPQGRRDLLDLHERDWDEYEKRSFNEFEKRDWDDYEMEARGLDFDELDELD